MKTSSSEAVGVVVVGPGPDAQGGITAVIDNYRKTRFWSEFGCVQFPSTTDLRSNASKAIYAFRQLSRFTFSMMFSPRPWAASLHASHSGSFYRKLGYLLICKIFRIPAVLHIHPAAFINYYHQGTALRQRLIKLAGRLSARIVFLSSSIEAEFVGILPSAKFRVLGNPVDVDYFSRKKPRETARPRVLFLGAILEAKGVYDLVECIPLVAREFPDVLFTFAGNREVEKLRTLVQERGLNNQVEVLGWIGGDTKLNLLHDSSVLVLPSYTEGVPNVLLEAMASELPIVTTPVGGIPSILEDDRTAVFIEPGNAKDIARGILSLLRDATRSASLAAAGFEQAKTLYSIPAISQGLTDIYDDFRPGGSR